MKNNETLWLDWVRNLQSIAQIGLTYSKDPFDKQRYTMIRHLASEIAAHHSQYTQTELLNLFIADKGYATPKLDIRGAAFQDDKVLLVREKADGLWTLPGGFIDVNESPSEAVTREIFEESGYQTKAIKVIAIYNKQKHNHPPDLTHFYKCIFLCRIIGGEACTSIETLDVGFFSEDDIPPLSLPRITLEQIKRCFTHYRQQDLPTDFD